MPRAKQNNDSLLNRAMARRTGGGRDGQAVDPVKQAEAVLDVIEGGLLVHQVAKKHGVTYATVRKWIDRDHYLQVAERYHEKLQELQERAILSVEKSIDAMNLLAECAADPAWIANADPDRITAMANLYKAQSDTTIRFFEAVQRAASRAGTAGQGDSVATDTNGSAAVIPRPST